MNEEALDGALDVLGLTADVVSAYVSRNRVPPGEMPDLISAINGAIRKLQTSQELLEPPAPAVPVKRSITPDHIISLEDGRPYKTLKRHLAVRGLTPDAYRAKWGLRSDYPMVAANYAERRSELAKRIGLGTGKASAAVAGLKRGRGRPKKAP